MRTYTQYGTFSIITLSLAILICIGLLFFSGLDEAFPVIVVGFVVLTLLICLLIFYKLTITIDDTYFSFSLGAGMIRKKYLLSDIEKCTSVRNSAIWGIGIRMIPSGWLYNVSGFKAVELTLKNSRRKIRIGTDQPEEVAREVSSRLLSGTGESFYEKEKIRGLFFPLIVIALTVVFIIVLVITGRKETTITFSDSSMSVSGMYGLSIDYSDIIQADTVQILPGIKSRTNGFAAGDVLKGHFKLSDDSKVFLNITRGVPPYILIKTRETAVYLNQSDSFRTRSIYQSIINKVSK